MSDLFPLLFVVLLCMGILIHFVAPIVIPVLMTASSRRRTVFCTLYTYAVMTGASGFFIYHYLPAPGAPPHPPHELQGWPAPSRADMHARLLWENSDYAEAQTLLTTEPIAFAREWTILTLAALAISLLLWKTATYLAGLWRRPHVANPNAG
jgi:hypothetical protein